jgi:hypothetical protein
MLSFITSLTDPLLEYIKDDPVRPEISKEFRVSDNRFVSALVEDNIKAMVCVGLYDFVPKSVDDLTITPTTPTTAIFYTIWSYAPGAGVDLLFQTVNEIQKLYPSICRFVTLSPKTEMAKRFHLKNGAEVLQENETTINYEYRMICNN